MGPHPMETLIRQPGAYRMLDIDSTLVWIQIAAAATIVVLAMSSFVSMIKGRPKLPPGPARWPLIGNIHLLGKRPHQSMQKLSAKYGTLMYMKIGSFPTYVVSSCALAKTVMKEQGEVFANRPPSFAGEILAYGRQDMLWCDVGPHWRLLRKISQFELFSTARVASYKTIRSDEMVRTLKEILADSKEGRLVKLDLKMEQLTLNNISRMLLSRRVFGASAENLSEAEELQTVLQVMREAVGTFVPGQFIPLLRWLDIGGHEGKLWAVFKRLDSCLSAILKHHRDNQSSVMKRAPDCMDVMISLSGEDQLKDEAIKAFCVDVVLGGSDTSAGQVQWAMAELMKHPACRKRAQDELRSVVGLHRLVEESDLPNLPYLQAIVKEAMRMHPAVPLISHVAKEDTELGGYRVAKGSRLTVNMYAIQRDPSVWERPLEFDPGRFSNPTIDIVGQDFTMLPFGAGKRICPGRTLGLLMVNYSLANLLHAFDWAMPPGQTEEDVDFTESFGITLPPTNPLRLVATPRLAFLETAQS